MSGRGHPEFILFGASPDDASYILNNFAFRASDGAQSFEPGQSVLGLGDYDYPVYLAAVLDSSEHLTVANRMYRTPGQPPVAALQICVPDDEYQWPWVSNSKNSGMPMLGEVPAVGQLAVDPIRLVEFDPDAR